MPAFRAFPIFWLIALALGGVVLWSALGPDERQQKSEATRQSGTDATGQIGSSDRDNAAEEVRAVATRIANIEQAIENQTRINQTARDRLHSSLKRDLEEMLLSVEQSSLRESEKKIASAVQGLETRVDTLEQLAPSTDSESGDFEDGGQQLHWIASADTDWLTPHIGSMQTGLLDSDLETLDGQLGLSSFEDLNGAPHLTIPATTTLLGATALTALVGRIPIRGQLQDPWRFKVLVGADNLASNGHRIPYLAGMLLAGTARGDLSLSCVSGNIDTATFIFADGTIQTSRKSANPESPFTGLGWISDEFGNPCISGELKSNALQYLAQATLVNTTKATAEAIANAQSETSTNPDTGEQTTSIVGDIDQFVAGYATKESLTTVADWLNDRQLNSFDAIYVPAGLTVAVHIEEAIHIDQNPSARKVRNFNLSATHANARQGWTD